MGQPQPLLLFNVFLINHKFYRKKTVGFSGIQTWIVRKKDKHADHLITTAVLKIRKV